MSGNFTAFAIECAAMATEPLSIESSAGTRTGQSIVRLTGSLNMGTEPRFLEQIRAVTAPVVILDLSGVHYCESRGVAALVQVYKTFELEKRRLALVGLDQRVEHVLAITKVLPLFTVFATLSEAEQALS